VRAIPFLRPSRGGRKNKKPRPKKNALLVQGEGGEKEEKQVDALQAALKETDLYLLCVPEKKENPVRTTSARSRLGKGKKGGGVIIPLGGGKKKKEEGGGGRGFQVKK